MRAREDRALGTMRQMQRELEAQHNRAHELQQQLLAARAESRHSSVERALELAKVRL